MQQNHILVPFPHGCGILSCMRELQNSFPGVTMSNNCRPQQELQLLALCCSVTSLKDNADGATQSCCLEHLYTVCTMGTLNCAQINICLCFFSGLYKLTAFLGSSQSLLRSLLLTLKKMFKKPLKADIYFDPEAQDFEEGEAIF